MKNKNGNWVVDASGDWLVFVPRVDWYVWDGERFVFNVI